MTPGGKFDQTVRGHDTDNCKLATTTDQQDYGGKATSGTTGRTLRPPHIVVKDHTDGNGVGEA